MGADLTDIKPCHRGADFYQELVRRFRENGGHWSEPPALGLTCVAHARSRRGSQDIEPRQFFGFFGCLTAIYWLGLSFDTTEDDGTWILDAHLSNTRVEAAWGPYAYHAEPTEAAICYAITEAIGRHWLDQPR